MTIPAGQSGVTYHTGNGTASTFDYEFKITAEADLKVTQTDTAGVDTVLVLNTDYTVTGVGNNAGGSITLVAGALASNYTLAIEDDVEVSQLTPFGNQSAFYANLHEDAYDKNTRIARKSIYELDRVLKIPASVQGVDTELPKPEGLNLFRWNEDGTALENVETADLITTAQFSNFKTDTFVDGVDFTAGTTTTVTLDSAPGTKANTQVYFDGVYQEKSEYSLAATVITFDNPIPIGVGAVEVVYGKAADVLASSLREVQFGDDTTTAFTLANAYEPGNGTLHVYINGVRQEVGYGYTETSSTVVTFDSAPADGDRLLFLVNPYTPQTTADANNVTYTHPYSGAVATNVGARLSQTVSVKDFGALGDGVTDDTASIQAAIDSVSGEIHFPKGDYKITSALIINNNFTTLRGEGVNSTRIYSYGSATDGILIRKDDWGAGTGNFISQVTLSDFSLFKSTATPSACYGIREILGSGTYISNVSVFDFPYGVSKEGCVNTDADRLRILCGTVNTNTVSGSYGLRLTSATLDDASIYVGFTHRFNQPFISSSSDSQDYGVLIEHTDVAHFVSGYIARQEVAAVYTSKRSGASSGYAKAITFDSCYFDGVLTSEARDGIKLFNEASYEIRNFVFNNCVFGQYETIVQCTHADTKNLVINGQVINCNSQAIYLQDVGQAFVDITGYNLNTDSSGTATINCVAVDNIDIKVSVENVNNTLVRINGSIGSLCIRDIQVDSSFSGTKVDLSSASITKYINTGAAIDYTPSLTFGGGSTGLTYTSQIGTFSVCNGFVDFSVYVVLSAKGSSTGNIGISLPRTPSGSPSKQVVQISVDATTGTQTGQHMLGILSGGTNTIELRFGNGTGFTTMTDAHVTDTTTFIITGRYRSN